MLLMYWSKLLNTTCEAIRVEPHGFVTYPIYKTEEQVYGNMLQIIIVKHSLMKN